MVTWNHNHAAGFCSSIPGRIRGGDDNIVEASCHINVCVFFAENRVTSAILTTEWSNDNAGSVDSIGQIIALNNQGRRALKFQLIAQDVPLASAVTFSNF
jgi:hypothetical protein